MRTITIFLASLLAVAAVGCTTGGGSADGGAMPPGSAGPHIAEPRRDSEAAQMPIEATGGAARPDSPASLNPNEASHTPGDLERHRPAQDPPRD